MDRYDDYRQPDRADRRRQLRQRPPQGQRRPDERARRDRNNQANGRYRQAPQQQRNFTEQYYAEQLGSNNRYADYYAYQDPYAGQDPYAYQDPYGYEQAAPQQEKTAGRGKKFLKKYGLYILVFFLGVLIGSIGGGGDAKEETKKPPQQQEEAVRAPEAIEVEADQKEPEKAETQKTTVKKTTKATEKKTESTTKGSLSPEDIEKIKNEALDVTYTEVMRNPDAYIGKYVLVGGKISQVLNGNEYYLYDDFNYGGDSFMDHRWGILYEVKDGDRILEGDIVNFYGMFMGTSKLTTVLGAEMEVPLIVGITHDFIAQAQ